MLLSFIFLPLFFPQCLSQGSTNEVSASRVPLFPPALLLWVPRVLGNPWEAKHAELLDAGMGLMAAWGTSSAWEGHCWRPGGGESLGRVCVCVLQGGGGGLESFSY